MLSPAEWCIDAQTPPQEYYGEPEQSGDLGLLYASGSEITARPIVHPFETQSSSSVASKSSKTLTVDRLLSPLAPRHVTAIRGLGLQYGPDPTQKAASPPVLCLFFKPSTCISGPEDVIPLPELATEENNDYEVELCVVIGKAAKDVRPEDAMNHVAGCASLAPFLRRGFRRLTIGHLPSSYCVVNDVSSRGLCAKGGQWGVGKTFDGLLASAKPSQNLAGGLTDALPCIRNRLVPDRTMHCVTCCTRQGRARAEDHDPRERKADARNVDGESARTGCEWHEAFGPLRMTER